MSALNIVSCSAVTAVGLDAFQTCAAIRSRITGFRACIPRTPPQEPLIAARVPTHSSLRPSYSEWLMNLASRAIQELLPENSRTTRLGIVLSLSATHRDTAVTGPSVSEFVSLLEIKSKMRFAQNIVLEDGGGGSILALAYAEDMLRRHAVDLCVVGGVDSLLNPHDVDRLLKSHRLQGPENPDGLIPGEAAAFVLVSRTENPCVLGQILGVGSAVESDSVLSPRYSKGAGLVAALDNAVRDSILSESDISFRVSNCNGERYAAWEAAIAVPRFYRTRREKLPVWYPAASVGDTGAASGTLTIVLAVLAIAGGYAPGCRAMCEASSEPGLRAVCVVGPAPGSRPMPFRPERGVSRHIREGMRAIKNTR